MQWSVFETRQTEGTTKQFSLLNDTTKKYIPAHPGVQNLEEKRDSQRFKIRMICETIHLKKQGTRNLPVVNVNKAIPIKCFVSHRPPSREGGSVGRAKKKKKGTIT